MQDLTINFSPFTKKPIFFTFQNHDLPTIIYKEANFLYFPKPWLTYNIIIIIIIKYTSPPLHFEK